MSIIRNANLKTRLSICAPCVESVQKTFYRSYRTFKRITYSTTPNNLLTDVNTHGTLSLEKKGVFQPNPILLSQTLNALVHSYFFAKFHS